MNIDAAIKKLTKKQIESAEEAHKIGAGVVFFSTEFIQPIFVTENAVKGLNANNKNDREIIRAAQGYKQPEEKK